MQDRICRIDENLLHRAAGPYIRDKPDIRRRVVSEGLSRLTHSRLAPRAAFAMQYLHPQ